MPSLQHLELHFLYTARWFSKTPINFIHNGGQEPGGEQAATFNRALHYHVDLSDFSRVTPPLVRLRLANT